MSKTPVQQNFPEFNRFLFCCSLQIWVNNQEVNSSYHWKIFPFIYQHGLYLNPLVSDAISTADFYKRLRVSINKFCRVIDRQIASSNLHKSNMKRRNKLEHCYRSLTVLRRSTIKCTTKPVGKMLDRLAIVFEDTTFKEAFCSLFFEVSSQPVVNTKEYTLYLSPLPSGLVSEHEQICEQKLRMRYRMSVIYGHPLLQSPPFRRPRDQKKRRLWGREWLHFRPILKCAYVEFI